MRASQDSSTRRAMAQGRVSTIHFVLEPSPPSPGDGRGASRVARADTSARRIDTGEATGLLADAFPHALPSFGELFGKRELPSVMSGARKRSRVATGGKNTAAAPPSPTPSPRPPPRHPRQARKQTTPTSMSEEPAANGEAQGARPAGGNVGRGKGRAASPALSSPSSASPGLPKYFHELLNGTGEESSPPVGESPPSSSPVRGNSPHEGAPISSSSSPAPSYDDSDTEEEDDLEERMAQQLHEQAQQLLALPALPTTSPPSTSTAAIIKERDQLIQTLPEPLKEFIFPEDENISEHEKLFNREFFVDNVIKTPERYIRIRNYCIHMWQQEKPKFVSKTAVREGLKDCGDVNAIGRVHEYLEKLGALNFGAGTTRRYNRKGGKKSRDPSIKHRRKRRVDKEEASPVSSPARPVSPPAERKMPAGRRKTSRGEAKAPLGKGGLVSPVVACGVYPKGRKMKVRVSVGVEVMMEMHARMEPAGAYGFLAGPPPSSTLLSIQEAIPCEQPASPRPCQVHPTQAQHAQDTAHARGLALLGYYHAHPPTASPSPTEEDVAQHAHYQSEWRTKKNAPGPVSVILQPRAHQASRVQYHVLVEDSPVIVSPRVEAWEDEEEEEACVQRVQELIEYYEHLAPNRVELTEGQGAKDTPLHALMRSLATLPLDEDVLEHFEKMLTDGFS